MKNSPFQRVIQDVQQKRHKAIEEACLLIEADAKVLAPIDTGTLKRSITHDVQSDEEKTVGAVGTNVEYAYFAELKKPYLSKAVDMNRLNIQKIIEEALKP